MILTSIAFFIFILTAFYKNDFVLIMGGGRDKNKITDSSFGGEGLTEVVKAQRECSIVESLHNVRYVKAPMRK